MADKAKPAGTSGGQATTSAGALSSEDSIARESLQVNPSTDAPNSIEAEQALLGSLLIDPAAFARVGAQIDASAFYSEAHAHIFAAIGALWRRGDPPDTVTVTAELDRRGRLAEVGGAAYLIDLVNSVPSALNIDGYLHTVKDRARGRRMQFVAELYARAAYADGSERDRLLEQAQTLADSVRQDGDIPPWTLCTLADAFAPRPPTEDIVERLLNAPMLAVLYGAPDTLKTMVLMDMGLCVAGGLPWLPPMPGDAGPSPRPTVIVPVLWLDQDNGKRRMDERVEAVARELGLESGAVPFYYASMPSPPFNAQDRASTEGLIRQCKALSAGLVIIDNLGVVSGDADENSADMAYVMANLRHLAEASGAAVVIVHHQRKGDSSKGRKGETLRGHSSIEAALDLALLVERDEGADGIVIQATKSRGAPVPPFGAMFTYEHREGTRELYRARFYGQVVEDKSPGGRATRAILAVLAASDEPLNKTTLTEAAYAATEGVAVNYIRRQIEILAEAGRLTVRPGPFNAQLYALAEP